MDEQTMHQNRADELDRSGFIVWKKLLDPALIDEHVEGWTQEHVKVGVSPTAGLRDHPPATQQAVKQARSSYHRNNPPTQRLLFNPELLAFLRYYFRDDPVLRQPETGIYNRNTPLHTDSLDFKVEPERAEVRIWCALEDVRPEAGPVYFVPRSHELIAKTLEENAARVHPEFLTLLRSVMEPTDPREFYRVTYPLWSFIKDKALAAGIKEHGLEYSPALIEKGDVVIFLSDVVHGTFLCQSPGTTRKYMVAYFSAKNARWYQTRSYWGPNHDYRNPQNAIFAPITTTEYGSQIDFEEIHQAYLRSFARSVVKMPNT